MNSLNLITKGLVVFAISVLGFQVCEGQSNQKAVTYEDFGAVGDGVTDDMPAIQKAHEHANKSGLPVRSKPSATYHLGRKAITAVIQTDTDWGTSKFIIDDSQGVEKNGSSLFEIRSSLEPIPLKIEQLKRGQTKLDIKPSSDCLVYVENNKKRLFIRKGGNQNDGKPQQEVFVLKKDGSIIGAIEWDYDEITKITAQPIDETVLQVRGGVFTNIANQADPKDPSSYWARNISIERSKTIIEGVTHKITGEKDHGHPYRGFLSADKCAYVIFRDCTVDGRKTYYKPSKTTGTVPMGSYGYHANLAVDFRMTNCRMGNDIHDRSRWGVVASNFMKNFLVEKCTLSRVDVHMGVSGSYTIRDCTLGHAGLNAIGRGQLTVENTAIHSGKFISLRSDYGSTWEGDVNIRNCRWITSNKNPILFEMQNDGSHDFGYPCFMPKNIVIDNLTVEEPKGSNGVFVLDSPYGKSNAKQAFPYRLTESISIKNFKSTSEKPPQVSKNPEIVKAVKLVLE
jgi:hypothetical protein